jgi:hypothetical protein
MVTQLSDSLNDCHLGLNDSVKQDTHEPISSKSSQEIELFIDNAELRLKLANSKPLFQKCIRFVFIDFQFYLI